MGTNSDEGSGFSQPANTTSQFLEGLAEQGYDNATAQDLSILYPDIPDIGIPATLPGRPNATIGLQFKRTAAMYGDMVMTAPRRLSAQMWAKHGVPAYSYRFNVLVRPSNLSQCHSSVARGCANRGGVGQRHLLGRWGGPLSRSRVRLLQHRRLRLPAERQSESPGRHRETKVSEALAVNGQDVDQLRELWGPQSASRRQVQCYRPYFSCLQTRCSGSRTLASLLPRQPSKLRLRTEHHFTR